MSTIAEIRRNARLEREQGQEESYREVMDMIYGYVQYTEQNLSYTRFNGGFNKDEEDAIHHANYIANRITHFLHKSFAMYRVDIALSYLEEFIAKDCLINTSTDPHREPIPILDPSCFQEQAVTE